MMVRVPGRPAAVAVYTDAEHEGATRYASEVGGEIVPLPLAPPAGYIVGPIGSPAPLTRVAEQVTVVKIPTLTNLPSAAKISVHEHY
jgi:hypothetical protein